MLGAALVEDMAPVVGALPAIGVGNFRDPRVSDTRFLHKIDRDAIGGQGGASCTDPLLIDARRTVTLSTLFTGGLMGCTMITFTTGTNGMAKRTKFGRTVSAVPSVRMADDMITIRIVVAVISTVALVAKRTGDATARTTAAPDRLPTGNARLNRRRQCPAMTAWTCDETTMTVGRVVDRLIKARSYGALTGGATDQTILTETLAAGAACPNRSAILFTTWTTKRTVATDIGCLTGLHLHLVNA